MRKSAVAAALVAVPVVSLASVVAFAILTEHRPAPEESVPVECAGTPSPLRAGEPFTVLSWNVQYGASRKYHFFYDGGDAVQVDRADVDATVASIAGLVRREAPAVALLQEIDRGSDRTHRVDELPPIAAAAGAACQASATYHRSPFVPTPTGDPMGRVDMNLALLTRASMRSASRIQLPLLAEPRWRQMFNLKRALLTAEVPVEGLDQPLALAVTHLSAFSFGDGTLGRQVEVLDRWMEARPSGQPWILAGDMNLLPPGDDPKRLRTEADHYADALNPMEGLIARYTEIFGGAQLDPANRTYLPFGASEPDRKIDYVFVGGPIRVESAAVLRDASAISDHLPIRAVLVLGAPPPPKVEDAAAPDAEVQGGM